MTKAFQPDDFAAVADFLVTHAEQIDESEWDARVNGRSRAAISRAYYAVFLTLKAAVQAQRRDGFFPEHDVHAALYQAILAKLGYSHPLTLKLRSLRRQRRSADYDLSAAFGLDEAEGAADTTWSALEDFDNLREEDLKAIADDLYDRAT